jgi:Tfp pilus assembly protein PilO
VKKQVSLTPVLAIGLVIVVAVTWFVLIGPKRSKSAALAEEAADLQSKITLASQPQQSADEPAPVQIDVADIFRLAKAMPDREDMAGTLLELNAVAEAAGVDFVSIQPGTAVARGSYYATPVTFQFSGNYYDLTDFLFRLRNLVTVRDGVLDVSGRFYTLDVLNFTEAEAGFPEIQAQLTISAYTFGVLPPTDGSAPAPAAPPPPPAGGGETTGGTTTAPSEGGGTTTTPGTTTHPPSSEPEIPPGGGQGTSTVQGAP